MLNHVIIQGRLGQDPEIRTTTTGKLVCSGSLAQDQRRRNRQTNEWETTETYWFNIEAWGNDTESGPGDFLAMLSKGMLIEVEGKLRVSNYVNNDGVKQIRTIINVQQIKIPVVSAKTFDVEDNVITFRRALTQEQFKPSGVEGTVLNQPAYDYDEEPF